MKLTNILLVVASVALAAPAFAAHGPFVADDGNGPGNFEDAPTTRAQPGTREPGANGMIARNAEKGNPNEDGVNEVIDGGLTGGGLFFGQTEEDGSRDGTSFPGRGGRD